MANSDFMGGLANNAPTVEELRADLEAAAAAFGERLDPDDAGNPENWQPAYVALYAVKRPFWETPGSVLSAPTPGDEVRGVGYARQPILSTIMGLVNGRLVAANAEPLVFDGDYETWTLPITHTAITDADGRILQSNPLPEPMHPRNEGGMLEIAELQNQLYLTTLDDATGEDSASDNPFVSVRESTPDLNSDVGENGSNDTDSAGPLVRRPLWKVCGCRRCKAKRRAAGVPEPDPDDTGRALGELARGVAEIIKNQRPFYEEPYRAS